MCLQIPVLTLHSLTRTFSPQAHLCAQMLPGTFKAEPVWLPALRRLRMLWCTPHLLPRRLRGIRWARRTPCSAQRGPAPWRHLRPSFAGSLRPAAAGTMLFLWRAAAPPERKPACGLPSGGRGLKTKGARHRGKTCRRRRVAAGGGAAKPAGPPRGPGGPRQAAPSACPVANGNNPEPAALGARLRRLGCDSPARSPSDWAGGGGTRRPSSRRWIGCAY